MARLQRLGIHGARTLVVNTDAVHLDSIQADRKILIGATFDPGPEFVESPFRYEEHPELLTMMFGNYTRVLLLTQTDDPAVVDAGRRAAQLLGLRFEHRHVGLTPFSDAVSVTLRKAV